MHNPLVALVFASITIMLVGAWITHVIWFAAAAYKGTTRSDFTWGLAGVLIPALGMLHGFAIWLEASQYRSELGGPLAPD